MLLWQGNTFGGSRSSLGLWLAQVVMELLLIQLHYK